MWPLLSIYLFVTLYIKVCLHLTECNPGDISNTQPVYYNPIQHDLSTVSKWEPLIFYWQVQHGSSSMKAKKIHQSPVPVRQYLTMGFNIGWRRCYQFKMLTWKCKEKIKLIWKLGKNHTKVISLSKKTLWLPNLCDLKAQLILW